MSIHLFKGSAFEFKTRLYKFNNDCTVLWIFMPYCAARLGFGKAND